MGRHNYRSILDQGELLGYSILSLSSFSDISESKFESKIHESKKLAQRSFTRIVCISPSRYEIIMIDFAV